MAEFVKSDASGPVATINLVRPELHNAFNEFVIDELTRAFADVGRRDDLRVVVLRSEGKSFCAGADVNWMKRMIGYSFEENVADANLLADMLRTIRECPKPVIARVHGAALGGGVGLIAACDIVAALTEARFCLSEVKLGILPAVISPYVIEKIGAGQARRYAITAETFQSAEARRIGLVSEVFDTVEAMDAWIDQTVETLLANGPEAIAACKRVLRDVYQDDWNRLQRLTTERIAERRISAEGQDGLKSFLEKRKPGWISN